MDEGIGRVLSIKELAYNNLKSRIISGRLKPGSRLLEAELAEEMDISRAPIREALNMLEKDGFARIIPRKGAIVSEITECDIFSIWELRLMLEPYAARFTVDQITCQELESMEKKIIYVREHLDDFDAYMESDLELHDMLCRHLDSKFMQATLENIKAHSLRVRWEDEYTEEGNRLPETPAAVNREHYEIIEALKTRDPELVYKAVLGHVLNSTYRIMKACNLELTTDQKNKLGYFEAMVK